MKKAKVSMWLKPQRGSVGIWILWIVLTILVAGGLVYYFQFTKIPDLNTKISDLQDQVNKLQEEQKQPVSSTETYTNDQYGFKLTFAGDFWQGYKVVNADLSQGSVSKDQVAELAVYVPTTDKDFANLQPAPGYVNVISLDVFTPTDWTQVQKEEGPIPELLGRTDKYVIGYQWTDDPLPQDVGSLSPAPMREIIDSFEKI